MTYTPIAKGTQNWDVPLNAALAQLDANITTSTGTALQAANNLSDLTNAPQARINLGLTGLANSLSNMTATTNPSTGSDNTQGYSIGSTWFNTLTSAMFVATNVSTGAAVWLQIPPTFVDRTSVQTVAGTKTFTSTVNTLQTGDATSVAATYTGNNANNGAFTMSAFATTGRYLDARVSGDTSGRYAVFSNGVMEWGPGNAGRDTNLYRAAANLLQTDDSFSALGDLSAANFTPGVWTTFTSSWTSSGTAPAIGNGTISARYSITGNTVNMMIDLVAGSTTTFGTGGYSFSLPFTAASGTGTTAIGNCQLLDTTRWAGHLVITPGASTASPFMTTSQTDGRLAGLSSTVPQTLTTAAQIRISATYEMA